MNGGSWVAGGATEGSMSPHPTSPSHFGAPSGSGASARARSATLAIASAVLTEFAVRPGVLDRPRDGAQPRIREPVRAPDAGSGARVCGGRSVAAGYRAARRSHALRLAARLRGPDVPLVRTVRRPRHGRRMLALSRAESRTRPGSRGAGNDRRSRAVLRPRTLDLHAGGARNPPGVSRASDHSARRSRSCSPWGPPGSGSRFAAAFLRCLHAPVSWWSLSGLLSLARRSPSGKRARRRPP